MGEQHEPVQVRHEGVIVVRNSQGDLVARKAARDVEQARLVHELTVLRLLDGLDVTRPVDRTADGSQGSVDLVYIGARTLADAMAELTPSRLLAILSSAATILQAAHERGICHRRLDASHVLLGPGDRAVLCGWSEAGIGTPRSPDGSGGAGAAAADPAAPTAPSVTSNATSTNPAQRFDPAVDVAAMGELAQQAVDTNRVLTSRARTQLAAVATAARHPDPAVRPPMEELARVLSAEPATQAAAPRTSPGSRTVAMPPRRLVGRVAAALTAAVAAALVTVQCAGGPRSATPPADPTSASTVAPSSAAELAADDAGPEAVDAPSGDGTTTESTEPGVTTAPPGESSTACPTTAEELALAGLPTSCAQLVRVDGERLTVAGLTYALGAPGDQAGLTDATCDGRLEPTLVQTTTGRLFVFDQWAAPGQPAPARPVGTVIGATGLIDPLGATCGPIRVSLTDGRAVELPA